MTYQKLNLADGEVLTAAHLAHIESGIEAAKLFGAENAGKLLYINSNGEATILVLGTGLQIVDGVLSVIGGSSGGGNTGGGDSGDDSGGTGAVELTVGNDGTATVAGATLTVTNGDGKLSGATLTVGANGDATIA